MSAVEAPGLHLPPTLTELHDDRPSAAGVRVLLKRDDLRCWAIDAFPLWKLDPLAQRPWTPKNRTRQQASQGGTAMKVTTLASTCDKNDCPTIYKTDRGTILVQGETPTDHGLTIPAHETLVEIPLDLIRKAFGDRLDA